MENKKISITTIDNPFDPFEEFDEWFMFDIEKGYYTCSKLARLIDIEEELSYDQEDELLEEAINKLIEIDPLDIYIKVTKDT